jgi:hypothetical protein
VRVKVGRRRDEWERELGVWMKEGNTLVELEVAV